MAQRPKARTNRCPAPDRPDGSASARRQRPPIRLRAGRGDLDPGPDYAAWHGRHRRRALPHQDIVELRLGDRGRDGGRERRQPCDIATALTATPEQAVNFPLRCRLPGGERADDHGRGRDRKDRPQHGEPGRADAPVHRARRRPVEQAPASPRRSSSSANRRRKAHRPHRLPPRASPPSWNWTRSTACRPGCFGRRFAMSRFAPARPEPDMEAASPAHAADCSMSSRSRRPPSGAARRAAA